jgi:hypothetical protein
MPNRTPSQGFFISRSLPKLAVMGPNRNRSPYSNTPILQYSGTPALQYSVRLKPPISGISHLVGEGLKDGNDTLGAASAPAAAWKNGFSLNPKMPAYREVGKDRT